MIDIINYSQIKEVVQLQYSFKCSSAVQFLTTILFPNFFWLMLIDCVALGSDLVYHALDIKSIVDSDLWSGLNTVIQLTLSCKHRLVLAN